MSGPYLVSLADPAWPHGKDDDEMSAAKKALKEYGATRDPKDINLRPGAKAQLYHYRDLTLPEYLRCDREATAKESYVAAFLFGVTSVTTPNGKTLAPEGDHWTIEEVGKLFAPVDLFDIGEVLMTRALLGKDSSALYAAPPSSLYGWALRAAHRQHAEQTQASAGPSSDGP